MRSLSCNSQDHISHCTAQVHIDLVELRFRIHVPCTAAFLTGNNGDVGTRLGRSMGETEHVKLNYYLKNLKFLIITVILVTSYSKFLWTHTFFGSEEANNQTINNDITDTI